jgi:hypothetical protein
MALFGLRSTSWASSRQSGHWGLYNRYVLTQTLQKVCEHLQLRAGISTLLLIVNVHLIVQQSADSLENTCELQSIYLYE